MTAQVQTVDIAGVVLNSMIRVEGNETVLLTLANRGDHTDPLASRGYSGEVSVAELREALDLMFPVEYDDDTGCDCDGCTPVELVPEDDEDCCDCGGSECEDGPGEDGPGSYAPLTDRVAENPWWKYRQTYYPPVTKDPLWTSMFSTKTAGEV